MDFNERVGERIKVIGTRKDRKIRKYSNSFKEIFNFFLSSYLRGVLTFGGEYVDVNFDINGTDAYETIRRYENGEYKVNGVPVPPNTRHPNIVRAVITAKKSFGLHVQMWSEGIRDWCFTQEEILEDFTKNNIIFPESLLIDFNNWILKKKEERYENNFWWK